MVQARLTRRGVLAAGAGVAVAGPAQAEAEHPLAGQTIELSVMVLAGSAPSRIAEAMAPSFAGYARQTHGYDASIRFGAMPYTQQLEVASTALASPEHQLFILDRKWIAALAAPKAIVPVNPLIQANPALDVAWYTPALREAYQVFPDGTNNRWGFPQAGDALVLFVRGDMLAAESEAFQAAHGRALPRDWEAFEALGWDEYATVLAFFTRPEQGLYGFASAMSGDYDFISGPALSFLRSAGGEVWAPVGGQVEGVLNTDGNARALAAYKSLLQYQPPDALGYGPAEVSAAFAQGRVFSALQWASAGSDVIGAEMRDKVMVVPAPTVTGAEGKAGRNYLLGGQSWLLNAASDAAHRRVATDFLAWWFRPETALDYARRGGAPCDMATLSRPDFDALQPWFRAYRTMLQASSDFWHDPKYAALLAVQQEAFTAYAGGRVEDPRHALDTVACGQQAILFDEGTAERQPSEACRGTSALPH